MCLCPLLFDFWISWLIFIKFRITITPLKAISTSYFRASSRKLRKAPLCLRKVCLSVRLSVLPHLQTLLFPDGFLWSSILTTFIKICPENPNFVNIRHFTCRTKYIYIVDSDIKHSYRPSPPAKMLGQPRKYKQFTIFCTSTTPLQRTHCCIPWQQCLGERAKMLCCSYNA